MTNFKINSKLEDLKNISKLTTPIPWIALIILIGAFGVIFLLIKHIIIFKVKHNLLNSCIRPGKSKGESDHMIDREILGKQNQVKRFVLSHYDLEQAKKLAKFLIDNENCEELIKEAFCTACVVSYIRPFSENKGGDVAGKVLRELNQEEKKLHKKMKDLRNDLYAHSDPVINELKISIKDPSGVTTAFPIKSHPYASLAKNDLTILLSNIEKIQNAISYLQASVQEHFQPGDRF